jgi:hypothetical protein
MIVSSVISTPSQTGREIPFNITLITLQTIYKKGFLVATLCRNGVGEFVIYFIVILSPGLG